MKSSPRLESFLSIEDGTDPQIGLAVYWERSAKEIMSYPALRPFCCAVQRANQAVKKGSRRYP
jgi:hypothetical protein